MFCCNVYFYAMHSKTLPYFKDSMHAEKKSVTDLTMHRAVTFKSLEQNAYSSYDGVVVFLHSTVLVERLSSSVRKECKA